MLSCWACSLGRRSNHVVLAQWPLLPGRRVVYEVPPSSVHDDMNKTGRKTPRESSVTEKATKIQNWVCTDAKERVSAAVIMKNTKLHRD